MRAHLVSLPRSATVEAPAPPPANPASAAVPSPSATVCVVPDVVDDKEAYAVNAVQVAGLHPSVVAKDFPDGSGLPAGQVWATDPVPQDEPCGSTVTLYVQP
jgi:hypothetical protein